MKEGMYKELTQLSSQASPSPSKQPQTFRFPPVSVLQTVSLNMIAPILPFVLVSLFNLTFALPTDSCHGENKTQPQFLGYFPEALNFTDAEL